MDDVRRFGLETKMPVVPLGVTDSVFDPVPELRDRPHGL